MKILILTSSYPTRHGAYEGGFIADLATNLLRQGIIPVVLAPHSPGIPFRERLNSILTFRFPYFFPFRFERLAYGSGILFNIRHDFFAFAGIIPFCKVQVLWTLGVLCRERPDVLHSHWLIPQGGVGALVRCITGIPHIATVHGSDLALIRKNVLLTRVGSFIIRNSDAVTVNSMYMQRLLISVVPESEQKIRVIPMGVDSVYFSGYADDALPDEILPGRVILTAGRLVDWKGTRYLIEAMPDVIRHIPDARLVIIGAGPEMESLVRRGVELHLKDHITFLGKVSKNTLLRSYRSAEVFVLPSIQKDGNTEALGVVLLEAMASGCPVIGSNVGGIPDIITDGENGFLVPEQDPGVLADRIVRILSEPDTREKFRKNGYVRIQASFTWDTIAGRFSKVYTDISDQKLSLGSGDRS